MYAELHAKTNFSFLEGASHPDELVQRAAELGYGALAVTDRQQPGRRGPGTRGGQGGRTETAGRRRNYARRRLPLVLCATDRAAYGRLARLITQGRLPGGERAVPFDAKRAGRGGRRLDRRRDSPELPSPSGRGAGGEGNPRAKFAMMSASKTKSRRVSGRLPSPRPSPGGRGGWHGRFGAVLPRPVRRPLLSAGRAAPRAGRPAMARAAGRSVAADAGAAGGGRRRALSRAGRRPCTTC